MNQASSRRIKHYLSITIISVMAAINMLLLLFFLSGLYINTSNSIPFGIYYQSLRPIAKGEYVLFCAPDTTLFHDGLMRGYLTAGFCPGHQGYMLKQVAALSGDVVSSTADGVWVNGHHLPFSRPLPSDGWHRPLSHFFSHDYRLGASEVLVMTNQNPLSFDSRYFGLLQISNIKTVIKPLVTWPLPLS